MNYSSIIITAASVFIFSQSVVAQKGNQFLDRNYWKAKPAVSEIKAAISETNDLAELDKNQFDATVFAINEKNSLETILFLLQQKGNDVNKITHDGRTYLFWAAYSGNLELMKHLVKNGAKTNLLDEHGNTVMIFAASNGLLDQEIYQFLIKNGASLEHEKTTGGANALLCASPFMDDFSLIDFMKSQGISIDSKDDLGNGIFNYAARNGNKDFLSKLIDQGVDYKTLNSENGNAFVFACQGSRSKTNTKDFYEFLESLGINPAFTTTSGINALHLLAGKTKDPEIIQFFLDRKVDVNQKNKDGNTPFLIAAKSQKNMEIVKQLSANVRDFNETNKENQSALMLALESNSLEFLQFLVQHKISKTQVDASRNELTYYLLKSYSSANEDEFDSKLKFLAENEFSIFTIQKNGNSSFHNCVAMNNLGLLKKITNYTKENINASNLDGLTPLHIAAMKSTDIVLLKYMIELGANVKIATEFGETALDLALENEQIKSLQLDFLK